MKSLIFLLNLSMASTLLAMPAHKKTVFYYSPDDKSGIDYLYVNRPGHAVQLGKGWDPINPTLEKTRNCFKTTLTSEKAPYSTHIKSTFFDSTQDLDRFTAFDNRINLSANGIFAKGSGSSDFHFSETSFSRNRTVTWVMYADRDYDRQTVSQTEFSDEGLKIIQQAKEKNNPEIFYSSCGRSLVTSVNKAYHMGIIYKFHLKKSDKASKLIAAIQAKLDIANGTTNLDGSSSVINIAREVDSSVQVDVEAFSSKTLSDASHLEEVLGSTNRFDLATIAQKITDEISSIQYEALPIINFTATPLAMIFPYELDFIQKDNSLLKFDLLKFVLDDYDTNENVIAKRINSLNYLLSNTKNGTHNFLEINPDAADLISKEIRSLKNLIVKIDSAMNDCKAALNPDSCIEVELPKFDSVLKYTNLDSVVSLDGWGASASQGHGGNGYVYWSASFWPYVSFKNVNVIDHAELVSGEGNNKVVKAVLDRSDIQTIMGTDHGLSNYYKISEGGSFPCYHNCGQYPNGGAASRSTAQERANYQPLHFMVVYFIDGSKKTYDLKSPKFGFNF